MNVAPAHSKRLAPWLPLISMLLISFALRVSHIDRQSIWYDEGLSIHYARGSLFEILREVSQSDHPPLHSLLLHAWMTLCGDSEFAVRILSLWWGVIAVAWLYRLGRRISPTVGALTALLLAVSPFAVWYSQETRGYTMALALIAGTVDVAVKLWFARESRSWWLYAAYALLGAAAMYTHFYSSFVLLALNIAYLLLRARWLIRTRPGRAQYVRWLLAQIAVLAVCAPWARFVIAQLSLNATYWHGAVGWQQIVRRTLSAFSVGTTLEDSWAVAAVWAMSILALVGTLASAWHRHTRPYAILNWVWMLVPALILIAINRTRPKFSPRYMMNALPPFLMLASAGAQHLIHLLRRHAFTWRGWTAVAVLLLATAILGGATTRSLANHYLDKRLYRPDFRAMAHYIEDHASPTDLIVLVGGHSYPAFTYYYRGALPVLPLPDELLPTTQQPIDLRALETLDAAIEGRQNLWLVLWQASLADPTGLIVDRLEQTYHRLGVGQSFHELALLAFDVSPGPMLSQYTTPQTAMIADLGQQVRFLGYDLPVDRARGGETLYLYLYWQALPQIARDYKVFAQILDEDGLIIAQEDKIAGTESYPTSHWPAGYIARDRFLLTIQPDAKPGRYRLIAGLYNLGSDRSRLPVEGAGARGDHILITEIEIQDK